MNRPADELRPPRVRRNVVSAKRAVSLWSALCLLCIACGGADDTADPMAKIDMGTPQPADSSRPTPMRPQPWTTGMVERGNTGHQPSLTTAPNGTVAAAYFHTQGETEEPCTEVGDDSVPNKKRWTIRYAELTGTIWTPATAHRPLLLGTPVGLSLRFDTDSTPHIATMTGEPVELLRYCGANDVGLLTPGADQWDLETVVMESNEAMSGQPASDFGSVVGYWPGLAFDNEGQPAIAYRDVHGGGLQGDDLTRADMEFAWKRNGGWSNFAVDVGEGAGDFNQVVFDSENYPVILYSNPVEQQSADKLGLWITRSTDQGETWEKFRLFEGKTAERPSMVIHPTSGDLLVVFYNPEEGRPYIATWRAGDPFGQWQLEALGDPRYFEGQHPTIAIDKNGLIGVTWYRCLRVGQGTTCDPQDDGIIFSWYVDNEWITEIIDDGEIGLCGRYPNLTFGGDNRAVVVYQCAARRGDNFEFELRYARRKELR
jgi:hypothetical protein